MVEKIKMECPECGASATGGEHLLEKKIKCPKCNKVVQFNAIISLHDVFPEFREWKKIREQEHPRKDDGSDFLEVTKGTRIVDSIIQFGFLWGVFFLISAVILSFFLETPKPVIIGIFIGALIGALITLLLYNMKIYRIELHDDRILLIREWGITDIPISDIIGLVGIGGFGIAPAGVGGFIHWRKTAVVTDLKKYNVDFGVSFNSIVFSDLLEYCPNAIGIPYKNGILLPSKLDRKKSFESIRRLNGALRHFGTKYIIFGVCAVLGILVLMYYYFLGPVSGTTEVNKEIFQVFGGMLIFLIVSTLTVWQGIVLLVQQIRLAKLLDIIMLEDFQSENDWKDFIIEAYLVTLEKATAGPSENARNVGKIFVILSIFTCWIPFIGILPGVIGFLLCCRQKGFFKTASVITSIFAVMVSLGYIWMEYVPL